MGFIIQQQSAYDPVHCLHTKMPTVMTSLELTLSGGRDHRVVVGKSRGNILNEYIEHNSFILFLS